MAVMAGRRVDVDNKCTWDMLSLRCLWNIPIEKAVEFLALELSGAGIHGGLQVLGEQSRQNNG